jgi:hypothetical protein
MQKSKHTAGPWIYDNTFTRFNGEIVRTAEDERPNIVCVVLKYRHTEEQRNANANLIAAAPDMYEALKGFVDYYAGNKVSQLGNGYARKFFDVATLAIAKAETGQ